MTTNTKEALERFEKFYAGLDNFQQCDMSVSDFYVAGYIAASAKLKAELEITNKLLDDRNAVLSKIPGCPIHGYCLPNFSDWIESAKKLEVEIAALKVRLAKYENQTPLFYIPQMCIDFALKAQQLQSFVKIKRMMFTHNHFTLSRSRYPMSGLDKIIDEVKAEMARAVTKFPTWPTDPLHAASVLGEEYGELTKAILETIYEYPKSTEKDVRKEAIQTAAMALRFLLSIDRYKYMTSDKHEQNL